MNKKQQWKEYRKALRAYLHLMKHHLNEVDDYIDDMDQDGQTQIDPPKPPIENPPPPPPNP